MQFNEKSIWKNHRSEQHSVIEVSFAPHTRIKNAMFNILNKKHATVNFKSFAIARHSNKFC